MSTPPADEPDAPSTSGSPTAGPPPPATPPTVPPAPLGVQHPSFAPVPRAPRVPWVNPDRRTQLIGGGVVAAVLLLGAGFGIGYAVAPSDDNHGRDHMYRMYLPGNLGGGHMGGYYPGQLQPGKNRYPMPRQRLVPVPGNVTTVTVVPSGSSTS